MTQLETVLRTIYDEKETKLLPENIKDGVTVLGVTGTCTGFDINNQVLRYDTKAALDAATDLDIGTKGVIYGGLSPYIIPLNNIITSLYLPSTITLTEQIVDTINIGTLSFQMTGGVSVSGTITCPVNPNGFTLNFNYAYSSSVVIGFSATYTSNDGITYSFDNVNTNGCTGITWDPTTRIISWSNDDGISKSMTFFTFRIKDFKLTTVTPIGQQIFKYLAPTYGGIYEFGENGYENCETQLTASSNADIFPGKIAMGVDGNTYVGDNSIYDHFSVDDICTNVYGLSKMGYSSAYNGYDFYNLASTANTTKPQYVKTATDLSVVNDGCIGTFNYCRQLVTSGVTIQSPYTDIRESMLHRKYNYIITTQFNTNDTNKVGAIVIYDYDTKQVVHTSTEYNYANTGMLYAIGEDYVAWTTYVSGTYFGLRVINLQDFTIKTLRNLSVSANTHSCKVVDNYIVYAYRYQLSDNTYSEYTYAYNPYTDTSAKNIHSISGSSVTTSLDLMAASDSSYLYVYTRGGTQKLTKYDKTNRTNVYSVACTDSLIGTAYGELSDNLSYFFMGTSMIDKATGLQKYYTRVTLLDKDNNTIASTTTDSSIGIFEKDNKYYTFIKNLLGIGTIQSITDEGTNIKRITIKCEKIYHTPFVVYKNDNNSISTYIFGITDVLPSCITLNQDGSIHYLSSSYYRVFDITLREYEISDVTDYEALIIKCSTYNYTSYPYATCNMVLKNPLLDVSL